MHGGKTEAKTSDIFISKNVEVSGIARKPDNISLRIEPSVIDVPVHKLGEVTGKIFGLSTIGNDSPREADERKAWNLNRRWCSNSEANDAKNLDYFRRGSTKIFEVVSDKFAPILKAFDVPTLGLIKISFDPMLTNVGIEIGHLDRQQSLFSDVGRTMGRSDGSFHVAGLSNTASPSDNPEANVRKNEESGQPIKRFVIISNSTIGFGFRLLRRFWGGILGGLLFVAAIFWIDYRDRHPKRGRHHKAENDFGNAKPTQRTPLT